MQHFIRKHVQKEQARTLISSYAEKKEKKDIFIENKKAKKEKLMTNENIERMEQLANELTPEQTTKRIKKDKGLIERVESEKTMLTEDNKQLLLG